MIFSFRHLISVAFFLFLPCSLYAATITVNTTADEDGTGVNCSLREAVTSANTDAAFGGCTAGAGPDTIVFSALFNSPQTITLTIDHLVPTGTLTITGPGANLLTIQNGQPLGANSRAFRVNPGNTLNLSGVRVTGGNVSGNDGGGGILADGTVNLTGVHITGNTVGGYGAAIVFGNNSSTGSIINSTIDNNTANGTFLGGGGGGIDSSGTLVITNSTISGNVKNGAVDNGGGLFVFGGNVTITSSTITDNVETGGGSSAGGVYRLGGTVTVRNSIIAANRSNSSLPDVFGAFTSSGFNLIGNLGAATGFTNPTDQVGVSNANAGLAPLANNGGTTPTHLLNTGSFAIDRGSNFGSTTDQRSQTRPYDNPAVPNAAGGNGTDIGAFERQAATAAGVSVSGRVLNSFGGGVRNAIVQVTDQAGNLRSVRSNSFGFYRLDGLVIGESYVFSVFAKGMQFEPIVVGVSDEIRELNLVESGVTESKGR